MVREAEYFKNITHDEIDKKLKFMEMAVKGFGAVVEDSEEENAHEGSGYNEGHYSQIEGQIYDQNGEQASTQLNMVEASEKQEIGYDQDGTEADYYIEPSDNISGSGAEDLNESE